MEDIKPGMKDHQISYLNFYTALENTAADFNKGWINPNGEEDPFILAHLHLVAHMASDRAQMHSMIAQQRDNWNKLFQNSVITMTMSAIVLAALSGYTNNFSFSIPAFFLHAIVAFMMLGINIFQPSQLAQEQRSAARLCKKLRHDIEFMLRIAPQLRQDAQAYVDEVVGKLLAVDAAYPLPLTPMVLKKFPKEVRGPVLSKHADEAEPEILDATGNGWDAGTSQNLVELGELMRRGDREAYKTRAERAKKVNKMCAVGGPLCAATAATLNGVGVLKGMGVMQKGGVNVGVLAAMAGIMAACLASIAHDAQLGMIFELFRSSMGGIGEIEASIKRVMRMPVAKRENGMVFKQRVAYELGRKPEELSCILPSHKTAAALF